MTEWYYADHGRQRQGPVPATRLAELFAAGRLDLESLVWRQGLAQWQRLGDFGDELDLLQAPATAVTDASASGRTVFTAGEPAALAPRSEHADASPSTPAAALSAHEDVVRGGEVVYAGFWKRVAAYFIDALVVGVAGAIVGGLAGGIIGGLAAAAGNGVGTATFAIIQVVSQLMNVVIGVSYYGWMHSSATQATLGKMAVGIKVVRGDGERITFLRGLGRYFALFLSALPLGIGFAMAGFTQRKQALHDLVCDTLVVDRHAFTDQPGLQRRELGGVAIAVLVIGGLLLALFVVLIGVAGTMAASGHRL
ncbi:MAG: RDD family protein [Pseudoxanthomonas sp.]